jgi:beta-glucosidase
VPAILEAYLGGQAGGGAIARVLFGEVNPSGKLAETFPQRMEDVPCHEWFPGEPRQVQYREGIWVGYRYYDTAGVKVAFPFGHGLSYTSFRYGELRVSGCHGARGSVDVSRLSDWQGLVVKCEIANVGSRAGAEVVQLYVADRISSVHRPRRELRGFEKVFLEPGEEKTVCFELGSRAFAFWDTAGADWAVEAGEFDIEVGASSADIRLTTTLDMASDWQARVGAEVIQAYYRPEEKAFDERAFISLLGHPVPAPIPLKPFHINSTLGEIRETFLGGLLFRQARKAMARIIGDNPSEKHLLILEAMIKETPLRSMVLMTSGGKFGFRQATVLIHLMNHRYGKALKAFTRGESA